MIIEEDESSEIDPTSDTELETAIQSLDSNTVTALESDELIVNGMTSITVANYSESNRK